MYMYDVCMTTDDNNHADFNKQRKELLFIYFAFVIYEN